MSSLIPVLLAGGSGTRLWPTSRKSYPKQFVDLTGSGYSVLQSTLKRSEVIPDACPWIIITGEDYRFLVAQQAKEIKASVSSILLEPAPRNTAPAIALAAFEALESYNSPKLLVQTADHHITNLHSFSNVISQAFESKSPFILFGVQPISPETGYGYIECSDADGQELLVSSFKEKPDADTALAYINSGNYLWNSGMFMLDADAYLTAVRLFEPKIYAACKEAHQKAISDLDFKRINPTSFTQAPAISVDYAVMERLPNLRVIPYGGDWHDIGAWDSVASLAEHDEFGNAIQGDGFLIKSDNTFIKAEYRLVTGVGLSNLLIIETNDAVLVAQNEHAQDIKHLVETLTLADRQEITEHRKVYRPWGSYETLISATGFKVKQITVDPQQSLSLQVHKYRAEHWVVVSGEALVEIDGTAKTMTADQSVYIPIGGIHRLTNATTKELIIIEVQTGKYLGEDDITRLDDRYHRV